MGIFVFSFANSANAAYRNCYGITVGTSAFALSTPAKPWNQDLNFREVERQLLNAKIIAVELLSDYLTFLGKPAWGSTEAYAVFFENGLIGVFKPESKLWNTYGELLVYRLSEYFGYHLVPPTVIRTFNGQTGSLQMFVETKENHLSSQDRFLELYARVPEVEKERERLIHYLAGQWDRHSANLVIDDAGHLVTVDNADAATEVQWTPGQHPWTHRGGELPPAGAEFPFQQYLVVQNPSAKIFKKMFGQYMSDKRIDRFFEKRGEYYKWFSDGVVPFVIWHGGLWIQRRQQMNLIALAQPDLRSRQQMSALQDTDLPTLMQGIELPGKEDEIRARLKVVLGLSY